MDEEIKKYYKKAYKDIEPVKDLLSEMTEKDPKDIHEMRKRLSKKAELDQG